MTQPQKNTNLKEDQPLAFVPEDTNLPSMGIVDKAANMSQSYQNMFGSFVTKYELGGILSNKTITDMTGSTDLTTKRLAEIEQSREARDHFFTRQK